jgi:hypothetical protein
MTVPLSSSLTNVLESPDIAEKKITTQSNPESNVPPRDSPAVENKITEIVTTTNINKALSAYLVLSSDFKSFKKIAKMLFNNSLP